MSGHISKTLLAMHEKMLSHFGPLHWWPGDTPFEVIVGAILTQNTAWTNVEKAIANIKQAGALGPERLRKMPRARLARLIRPSGYYNIKAKRLKSFLDFPHNEYGGSVKRMFREGAEVLREKLLAVNGIGPETADSILLYAGGVPTFVVDAYTKRILSRHALLDGNEKYEEVKQLFETNLPRDAQLYNEFHAQIVNVGKNYCRRKPHCDNCPLRGTLDRKTERKIGVARPRRPRGRGAAK